MPRDLQIAVKDNYPITRNDILVRDNQNKLKDAYLNDSNQDYYEQKVFIELRFFLGEWFLDIDKGVPYYENIFIKNPTFSQVESIFKTTILDTTGIESLLTFEYSYEALTREYGLKFRAKTEDDEIINYNVRI